MTPQEVRASRGGYAVLMAAIDHDIPRLKAAIGALDVADSMGVLEWFAVWLAEMFAELPGGIELVREAMAERALQLAASS